MNLIVYDLQGNRIRNLNGKASHHYVFSGLDTTAISAVESEVKKGYRLLYQDDRSKWHEFIVSSITTAHTKDGIAHEIYAENSLISLRGESPIMDRRNISSPSKAMEIITDGTGWEWVCDLSATGNLSFYHISPFDALSETLKTFGGEFYTQIRVEGNQITRTIVLTDRVGEDHGKRFSYRKDMASIKRKVKEEDVVTRLYPYGKGESVGDGYGRRVSISTVNGGKDYIENTAAQSLYGYKGGPFSAVKVYDSIEDAEELKRTAEKDLQALSTPSIEYEATVVDLKSYGMDFEGTSVGDTVRIRDKDLGLSLIGRVMELEVDPDGEEETKIKLGNIRENLDNRLSGMEKTLARISLKEGTLDALANHKTFVDMVVQGLNDAFKTSASYMRFSPEEGMIFTDNPDESKAKWAMNLGALGFRIANKKKPNGEWDFRTFGTGDGFAADLIRAGMLQGGAVKWNLETGYLNIGDKLIYDPATGELRFAAGSITMGSLDSDTQGKIQNAYDSTKELERGYTEIKEGEARFVTKSQLGTVGETSINGYNITTGAIRSQNGDTYIDLNGSNFNFGNRAMTYSPSDGLRIGGSRYYMTSDNRCFAIHSTEWRNGRLGGFRATTDDQNRTTGVMLYASQNFNMRLSTQADQGDASYTHHIVLKHNNTDGGWTEVWQDMLIKGCSVYTVGAGKIQATSVSSSSDLRLKKDIKPWDVKALDVINATDFIRFRWKEGEDTQEHYGVSAQSIPLAQVKRDDGYLAVDGYTMSAINGKAIQELSGEVKRLKEENEKMKKELENLKEAIHDLIQRR